MRSVKGTATSILGALVHTVAGLAAIASVLLLVAVAAFAAPSLVGGLGLNALVSGGTLADNVAHLESETVLSLPLLALALVASAATYVAGTRVGARLYAVGESDPRAPAASASDGAASHDARPPEELYLRTFTRSTLWIGVGLALLLVTALALRALAGGGQGGSGPLAVPAGFLWFAVVVFGGPFVLAVTAGAFLGVWYGLRRASREAAVAGIVIWGLMGLSGLGTLSRSGSGFGLLVAGVMGVYYGLRAFGATEPVTAFGENTFGGPAGDTPRRNPTGGAQSAERAGGDGTRTADFEGSGREESGSSPPDSAP